MAAGHLGPTAGLALTHAWRLTGKMGPECPGRLRALAHVGPPQGPLPSGLLTDLLTLRGLKGATRAPVRAVQRSHQQETCVCVRVCARACASHTMRHNGGLRRRLGSRELGAWEVPGQRLSAHQTPSRAAAEHGSSGVPRAESPGVRPRRKAGDSRGRPSSRTKWGEGAPLPPPRGTGRGPRIGRAACLLYRVPPFKC